MSIYDRQIALADRLITEKGMPITIRRKDSDSGTSAPDLINGDTISYTDYQCYAVKLPATGGKVQAFDIRAIDPNLTINEIAFYLTKAKDLPITPRSGDCLVINGVEKNILGNTPLEPDGTPIIHKMSVRK